MPMDRIELPHSIKEITDYFPDLPILEVWNTKEFQFVTYDDMNWRLDNGMISSDVWAAYQAIWRNAVIRFSTVASEYQF